MTREETLEWFNNTATRIIEGNHGLFCTFYYIYEDRMNPYQFTIGYVPYNCSVDTENGCDDCPYRTEHGDCGEYHLYINDDGTIYYEETGKTYNSQEFYNLLNEFC